MHSVGNLGETSNVGTLDQRGEVASGVLVSTVFDALIGIFDGSLDAVLEAVLHNITQLLVNFLRSPVDSLAVLGHFQTGNGNTTAVGSLTGTIPAATIGQLGVKTGVLEDSNSVQIASHVGAFSDETASTSNESLSISLVNFVLSSRGKSNINLNVLPGAFTLEPLSLGLELTVLLKKVNQRLALKLDLSNGINVLVGETRLLQESTLGVGEGNDLTTNYMTNQNALIFDLIVFMFHIVA